MATPQTTVRDIALQQPTSIRVFERFGIDYCCGGKKPLAEACQEHGLDSGEVLAAIAEAATGGSDTSRDWNQEKLEALCQHIAATHHAYVRAELPRLAMLAEKVVARHGQTQPHLDQIRQQLGSMGVDLLQHQEKEDRVLFPYITNLERNLANCGPRPLGCFGSVRQPIGAMLAEHDATGNAMAKLRDLSSNFTPPEGACPTYRGFYQGLAEFEQDLHRHIHLENNILFPRAIEMDEANA